MGTLVEEILSKRTDRQLKAGDIVILEVDYMLSHDNTTPLAIDAWKRTRKPIKDREKIVIHFDHAYPAPNVSAAKAQKEIVDFIKEQSIDNFFYQGICHQVMLEEGFVKPGRIIIGADSHTNTYGALTCFASGFGSSEIGVAWATGKTWFRVPETIHIKLYGEAQLGVTSKDVMIHILGQIGTDGAIYKSIEFSGGYVESLPMHDRIVFANMSTESGAKCGLIAVDDITFCYLDKETFAKGPFDKIVPVNPEYEEVIEFDVSQIQPQVACHPTVDNAKPLKEVEGTPINQVFIGTCTNGRYEDLKQAAKVLNGQKVNRFTKCIVTPASQRVANKVVAEGLYELFIEAGCIFTAPGCGACIGRHGGVLAPGEKAFTTMNRNFIGRMGSPNAEIYLGSPLAAAAAAIEGKIADPRKYVGD